MALYTTPQFIAKIDQMVEQARKQGKASLKLNAGELNNSVVAHGDNRTAMACSAMRKALKKYGGKVLFESSGGRGDSTTFDVEIIVGPPVVEESPETSPAYKPPKPVAASPKPIAQPALVIKKMERGFEGVWEKINRHQGEDFFTITNRIFTYEVAGNGVMTSATKYLLAKSQFARAWERMPLHGPGDINDLRGPSYIYGILTDKRIHY